MTRLKTTLENLQISNQKAFSVFLMSGYPDKETFLDTMHLCANSGVDFMEIGMPFSDPSADGPVIKNAGTHALNNGTTVAQTINTIKEFRQLNKTTPIVWMGYFNSIYNYGIEKFLEDIENAGVDGLLIVDLPAEEFQRIESIKNKNLDLIHLVTPVTSKERLPMILSSSSGFIYFVSINGITGTKEAQDKAIKQNVEFLKSQTELPVIVGFGIKNSEKAKEINKFADGCIVGSAAISKITKYMDNNKIEHKEEMFKELKSFITSFKNQ